MDSGEHAPSNKSGCGHVVIDFVVMLALVVGCYFLLRTFVVGTYEIPSGSMEQTIQVGDRVFSEKITYYSRTPAAGEVVTFNDPQIPSRTLIKRCIAVAGQTVNLVGGEVVVDGVVQNEPYTNGLPSYPLTTAAGVTISYPYTVPDGYIWVMGDNRTNSADSRYFGAIPVSSVTGRANFIFWPVNHIGVLD